MRLIIYLVFFLIIASYIGIYCIASSVPYILIFLILILFAVVLAVALNFMFQQYDKDEQYYRDHPEETKLMVEKQKKFEKDHPILCFFLETLAWGLYFIK